MVGERGGGAVGVYREVSECLARGEVKRDDWLMLDAVSLLGVALMADGVCVSVMCMYVFMCRCV